MLLTFTYPYCCCRGCSVAFCVFLDEASDETSHAYYDAIRCALNEDVFHSKQPVSETGLTTQQCGLELFVELDWNEAGDPPTLPATCSGHNLPPIKISAAEDQANVSNLLLTQIHSRFGQTQWTNSDGKVINNPHPHKIIFICDDSGSTEPSMLDSTWSNMLDYYYDRGYTTQELLDQKFKYGHRSACANSLDQNAERTTPSRGFQDRTVGPVGGTTFNVRIEHIPVIETWASMSLYMQQWVLAYS